MEKGCNVLVTGVGGFIGFSLCRELLKNDINLIGYDNLNDYYDVNLKEARINILNESSDNRANWRFIKGSLEDKKILEDIFKKYNIEIVIHLAAQAGVRYSIENPSSYINSNLIGFSNILECCRNFSVKNFIYASSSSVYGGNTKIPFSEKDNVDHPVSLYAATKKSNEILAHSYSHLFKIPCTGLRFFTVYGPWGRPDMAPMIFTKAILNNEKIKIFNNGEMSRDFTFIDDVVEAIIRLIDKPATPQKNISNEISLNPSISWAPFKIFNLGNSESIPLMRFIKALEKEIGQTAIKEFVPMEQGDVKNTSADTKSLEDWIGFKPKTNLEDGLKKFVKWYLSFYGRT